MLQERDVEHGAILKMGGNLGKAFYQFVRTGSEGYFLNAVYPTSKQPPCQKESSSALFGRNIRRSPIVLSCHFFRQDFRPGTLEVLGIGEPPPAYFAHSWRVPSEVVNYLTGQGPWDIVDDGTSTLQSGLTERTSKFPCVYEIDLWDIIPFYQNPRDFPITEVNERSVAHGLDQERKGTAPEEIYNVALDVPSYPPVPARSCRLLKGYIVEIPSVRGLAYLQVTPHKGEFGPLYRVFKGYWQTRPEEISPDLFSTKFLLCCPFLRDALEDGRFQRLGRIDLVDDDGSYPIVRQDVSKEYGWYITGVRRPGASRFPVEICSKETVAISPTDSGESVNSLLRRFDLDWSPEKDLESQIAVEKNRAKLERADSDDLTRLDEVLSLYD